MNQHESRTAAIFVDFDNLRLGVPEPHPKTETAIEILRQLLTRLELDGIRVLVRRAYADWENEGLGGVQAQLSLMSVLPVFVLGQVGKNSADLEMSLDCLELLLSRDEFDRFVLVAGDRDFIPVVRRIIEAGKKVRIASFRNSTSADLVEITGRRNFLDLSRFLVDTPKAVDATTGEEPATEPRLQGVRPIEEALAEADEAPYEVTEEDMERAMRLVVQADRKYRGRGIWLVPFFKEWMNPEFDGMNNDARKGILGQLTTEGAVRIETREDGLGRSNSYSVLVPDREHQRFVLAEEQTGDEEPVADVAQATM
jgi:NYN domain